MLTGVHIQYYIEFHLFTETPRLSDNETTFSISSMAALAIFDASL